MLFVDRPRQYDDPPGATRRQREAMLRRAHVGQRAKRDAKPPDFHAQPRAVGFVGVRRPERQLHEQVSRYVARPRFAQHAGEREQYRTPHQRDHDP